MTFYVSRQKYWGVEEEHSYMVEIAKGGIDFANPDMLTPQVGSAGRRSGV